MSNPNQNSGDMKIWGLGTPNKYSWKNTAALWDKKRIVCK